ncbi:hypothetical protein EJ04DRAFT_565069 [Polyplosphaeria fusca]|uniref:Uncharacterized protein n=1 Tax=Polyplosphaeria fusca TaxID=682080 RepID=A0A9P4QYJ1_9PLEO|nr:hypothetical protein EJ04DRAFT_565069 [Polyplosphaeria fusca]
MVHSESQASRTVFTMISLACIAILAGMLGYRAQLLRSHHLKTLNLTRVLILVLYSLAMAFVVSAAVVENGLGMTSPSMCHSIIYICLSFYAASKLAMYIFLVERAHALRAPYMSRFSDWIWLSGMLAIVTGFSSLAVCGFLWPIGELSKTDGRCRIGLPLKVTIPFLTFDIVINAALTGIFIYLLKPLLHYSILSAPIVPANWFHERVRRMVKTDNRRASVGVYPVNETFLTSIKMLLWKSLAGSIAVMLPTAANIAALSAQQGRELSWLCLILCIVDVTWAVCVIHWLTIGSTVVDERAVAVSVSPDMAINIAPADPL